MNRRSLLRRLAAAGAGSVTLAGVSAASSEPTVVWTFPDGRRARMSAETVNRRSDLPSFGALRTADCCDCPDGMTCECRYPDCETVEA